MKPTKTIVKTPIPIGVLTVTAKPQKASARRADDEKGDLRGMSIERWRAAQKWAKENGIGHHIPF